MNVQPDHGRVLSLVSDIKKREKTIEIFVKYYGQFCTGKGSGHRHHPYDGGLADHTMLVALLAWDFARKLPDFLYFTCNTDDIVMAAIFHDFDKMGKYQEPEERPFSSPLDVYSMLVDNGLSSKGLRDGIIHAHGGWSDYKDEPFGMVSILVHAADMVASHIIENRDDTRKAISVFLSKTA